jgi:hypothetical protein
VDFVQRNYPDSLPRFRAFVGGAGADRGQTPAVPS